MAFKKVESKSECLIQTNKLFIFCFLNSEFAKKNLIFVDVAKNEVISYEDATSLWKTHPDLQHIKMMRYKGAFSVCKISLAYELAIKGQNTIAQLQCEQLDWDFSAHLDETKKERAQYIKDQIKCSEESNKFVIAVDGFDKYKTMFPFFVNAPISAIEGATLVQPKLTAAMVRGFGAGVYCFWASDQLSHDTNLTLEVIQRTLLKIEEMQGTLPRKLYLQLALDNAKDNRSAQFLAFIAFKCG